MRDQDDKRPVLLACPFCANEYNGCPAPSVYLSIKDHDKAVEMWNRRTPPTGNRP